MHKELKCKPEKKTNTNKTIYEYTVQFFSNMGIDTISTTKMQNTNLQKTHESGKKMQLEPQLWNLWCKSQAKPTMKSLQCSQSCSSSDRRNMVEPPSNSQHKRGLFYFSDPWWFIFPLHTRAPPRLPSHITNIRHLHVVLLWVVTVGKRRGIPMSVF